MTIKHDISKRDNLIGDRKNSLENKLKTTNIESPPKQQTQLNLETQSKLKILTPFSMMNGGATAQKTMRWGLSIPLAGLMTLGLCLTMASLIAVEFMPQDKLAVLKADINPVAQDIKAMNPLNPPERFRDIEVPPPPPEIGSPKTDKVTVSPISVNFVELDIDLARLKIGQTRRYNLDVNYQPLVRVPPIMPNSAQRSGHCKVRFDVSSQGQPFNVEAVYCSDKLFARNTIKSVGRWKFRPRITDGQFLTVSGVENIVRFQLTDARGVIIPE